MTTLGVRREYYSMHVEPRPSRFGDWGLYAAWAERADAWGAENCTCNGDATHSVGCCRREKESSCETQKAT